MEWLDKLTQHTLFPGQYIYKVSPIFNEYDIQKVRVLDVTFSMAGLQNFWYIPEPSGGPHLWERDTVNYYYDTMFFKTSQEAIDWCKNNNKAFTIYD